MGKNLFLERPRLLLKLPALRAEVIGKGVDVDALPLSRSFFRPSKAA